MADNTTGRLTISTSTPLTDQQSNPRPRPFQGVFGPVDAESSSLELEGLGAADNSLRSFLFKSSPDDGQENYPGAATTAAASIQNSLGPPIAPISTASLDYRNSVGPIAVTNGLSSPASRQSSNPGATEPFNVLNDSTLFLQNRLKHGDTPTGASAGGDIDLHTPEQSDHQHASSTEPGTTQITTSSPQPATFSPANNQAPSANGMHRPDVASSNSPVVINKPVLKMKRTGQNFPLSSTTGSVHQRNRSYSPRQRQGSLSSRGSAAGKASTLVTKGAQQPANDGISKPVDERSSENSSTAFKAELQEGFGPREDSALKDSPAISARSLINDRGNGETSTATHDSDSDDIIYETAAQVGAVEGDLEDVIDHQSSSDDSDSQSDDDDETVEMDAGEASFQQLFRAPDQEDDYDDSEDTSADGEDDDATSESSSDDDSIADEEPTVALPSANIQHQEAYPSKILELAEPGRLYTEYRGTYS